MPPDAALTKSPPRIALFSAMFVALMSLGHAEVPVQSIHVVVAEAKENVVVVSESGVNIDQGIPAPRKLSRTLTSHLGKVRIDKAGLELLADLVVDHLKRHHWPICIVSAWDEDEGLAQGRVTLQVQHGRLGDIVIVGGSKVRQRKVAEQVKDLAHAPLNDLQLQRRLDALAFSPWLACTPQIAPGTTFDTANLLLTLRDESPLHAFASYENNGVEPLGENRYSLGVQWLNAFGLGHNLTAMTTFADDPDTLTMYAGSWRIPLPWRHELRFSGYYADTHSQADVLGVPLDVGGTAWQAGARYVIPWRLSEHWRSEWQFGFDYKQFNTAFTFGSTAVLGDTTGVGTLVAGTQWFYDTNNNHARLAVEAAHGEPGWAKGHNEDEFEELVPGASPRFTVLRADAAYQHDFRNDMQAALRLGGQWSDGPVLPSEELGLASINAVRGYPERLIRASKGAWASFEVRSPQCQFLKTQVKLRALAFADGGWIANDHPSTDYIASVGLGLRAEVTKHLQLRCDLAIPLIDAQDDVRVHVAAVLKF